jgi:hypothetical protein
MAFHVNDRIYLQVVINGKDFPFDKLNLLDSLHIVESTRLYVPQLSLKVVDATKFLLTNNLLVDGAKIKVTIGLDDAKKTYDFRLFNAKDALGSGGDDYHISGYLDVPKFWIESTVDSLTGTPTEALQKIATACGMSFEGTRTSDSQIWVPYNTRYCEWARQITEHAWVDDQSCMQSVVTADKKLRLVNVTNVSRKPTEIFSNRGNYKSSFPITDFNVLSKSGFFNMASGYQDTRIAQSLTTAASGDLDLSQVNVKRNSRKLNVNADLKELVKQSRVSYAPIDVGNTGKNYERALYQNRRLSNLFTFGAEFVVPVFVEANVLDSVLCDLSKPDVAGIREISGAFILTSKVVYIQGMNFYQKCEVYRHGMNTTNTTQV